VRADALTQRPQDLLSEDVLAHREQVLLPASRFSEPLTALAQTVSAALFMLQAADSITGATGGSNTAKAEEGSVTARAVTS
jgi:hypothetical protein